MTSPTRFTVDAILYDMDGTLVDSTPAAEYTYAKLCEEHDIENKGHAHGVRMIDSFRRMFEKKTEEELGIMAQKFEDDLLVNAKEFARSGKSGIVILPGVERMFREVRAGPNAEEHYAICTSASRIFASEALKTAGIVPPSHLLTSDDVSKGKPDPEPYLKGAEMLQKDIKNCLVVEDAPAGIASGLAAGAKVVALCTSHKREQIEKLGAHYVIDNLDSLHVSWTQDNKIEITLSQI